MWTFITGLLPSLVGLAGKGIQVVDKKNQQIHDQQIGLRNQVSMQSGKTSITWWDSLVDGINRLVRPCFTFGTLAIFVWAGIDPITFSQTMVALALVPQYLWYILGTIVVFWFGQRAIEGIKAPNVTTAKVKQTIQQINAISKLNQSIKQDTKQIQKINPEHQQQDLDPVPKQKQPTLNAIQEWEQWRKLNG